MVRARYSSPSITARRRASASMPPAPRPPAPRRRRGARGPGPQGGAEHCGGVEKDAAQGLAIRHDHGSQYMSRDFQKEIAWLGATSSPAFVRAPEGNGCAERFIRTLKENLLWVRHFETIEELRLALLDFAAWYNTHWLVARHGHRTPRPTK